MWIITLLGAVLSVPVVVAVAGFLNGVSAKFLTMKVAGTAGRCHETVHSGYLHSFINAIFLLHSTPVAG